MKTKLEPKDIDDSIVKEQYYVFPGTTLTVCCLTLTNGYTVTGESACVDEKNFNAGLGEVYSKIDAKKKIWALEGYLLKDHLSKLETAEALSKRLGA